MVKCVWIIVALLLLVGVPTSGSEHADRINAFEKSLQGAPGISEELVEQAMREYGDVRTTVDAIVLMDSMVDVLTESGSEQHLNLLLKIYQAALSLEPKVELMLVGNIVENSQQWKNVVMNLHSKVAFPDGSSLEHQLKAFKLLKNYHDRFDNELTITVSTNPVEPSSDLIARINEDIKTSRVDLRSFGSSDHRPLYGRNWHLVKDAGILNEIKSLRDEEAARLANIRTHAALVKYRKTTKWFYQELSKRLLKQKKYTEEEITRIKAFVLIEE